jgi:peptidoglycan/xylan/chitin deacetylase (PgdA/CDA1 family)
LVSPNAVVLLYHRVSDVRLDSHSLCVTPEHFAEQMQVLRRLGEPVSLRSLTRGLRAGKLPHRGIVVTFDDGYSDNLYNAKPILEKHDVPATVFVAAGYVGFDGEYWWDELERILLEPGELPPFLTFDINGVNNDIVLGEASVYSEHDYCAHKGWNASARNIPTPRHALYLDLYKKIRPLDPSQRQALLKQICLWAGRGSAARDGYRPLTGPEIGTLVRDGLVAVGAHTVSHPFLSSLPLPAQRDEIRKSKILLENAVQGRVTGFAYPYGGVDAYTAQTVEAVKESEFQTAFTTSSGPIGVNSDSLRLPRHTVGNWDGERFARKIREWMAA